MAEIDNVKGFGSIISRMRVKLRSAAAMLLYRGFVTHLAEMNLPTVSGFAD
jgi:hypothetical protein